MSVSGVPSIPGFDVLFPSGNTTSINGTPANGGTSSTGTANSSPATTAGSSAAAPASTAQPAGFDVLFPTGTVPGTGTTKPANAAPTSSSTAQNPYQTAYDNIETWSSSYLLNSVENGTPSSAGISSLSGGESANSFAQLNSTLAALKPLIAIEGAEQNPATTPASSSTSGSGSSSTGSTVDSFA